MTHRGGSPHGPGSPVNPASNAAESPETLERTLGRHVEGWRPALVIGAMTIASAHLVVPAAVAPVGVPLPAIDRTSQARVAATRRDQARAARAEALPFEVRAVGEAFRRAGRAAAAEDRAALGQERQRMRVRAAEARARLGDEPLLRLRAVQAEMFVDAVRGVRRGAVDDEALELGGEFLDAHAAMGVEAVPDVDLESAFVVRWTLLADLAREAAFAPTLNDWRALHRVRLSSPRGEGRDRLRDQAQVAQSLGALDPDYPSLLAEGMIAYQLGDYSSSAKALRAFLDANPAGPWQLRARNYLAAALVAAPPPPPASTF